MIRPEDVLLGESGVRAEVLEREFYGHDQVLRVRTADGGELRVRVGPGEVYARLGAVALRLRREPRVFVDA